MEAPAVLIRPDLGKRPYRLKCRFKIEAHPDPERLRRGAASALEMFVRDMRKQGWEYDPRHPVKLDGPFPIVETVTLKTPHRLTSREMLAGVRQGARFLPQHETMAKPVTPLAMSEYWEFEVKAVFIRDTILTESPDPHEEKEMIQSR